MKKAMIMAVVVFLACCADTQAVEMEWVTISEAGFTGQMSKYETTNAQYCQFLNEALASGDITVSNNHVYGANGSNAGADFVGEPYFDTYAASSYSQIIYSGGVFSVRNRDGYSMSNHPVVEVSWYGATAFCNYYGYRLPTEWEWQAVADFDGSYTYGCGTTANSSKANYNFNNPLSLSSYPYTTPVDYYETGGRPGPYGYGMCDMAGNVWEWTSTVSGSDPVIRGGSWENTTSSDIAVSRWFDEYPYSMVNSFGFRVARDAEPVGPIEWAVADGGNGHYYDRIGISGTWNDAKQAAEALCWLGISGHLVTITSQEEQDFISTNFLDGSEDIYIGGYQPDGSPEPDGKWQWVTGETWDYANWYESDEPSNSTSPQGWDEDVVIMWNHGNPTTGGKWNDIPHESGLLPKNCTN